MANDLPFDALFHRKANPQQLLPHGIRVHAQAAGKCRGVLVVSIATLQEIPATGWQFLHTVSHSGQQITDAGWTLCWLTTAKASKRDRRSSLRCSLATR